MEPKRSEGEHQQESNRNQDHDDADANSFPVHVIAEWRADARKMEQQAIGVLRELGGCTSSRTTHAGPNDEVFTLTCGVEHEKQESVETLTRLTERQREVLQALDELGARSHRDRRKAREIAKQSCGKADPATVKNPLAELGAMGFVGSEQGRNGGSWLTPEGQARQRLESDSA